jgi:hypothetical protein
MIFISLSLAHRRDARSPEPEKSYSRLADGRFFSEYVLVDTHVSEGARALLAPRHLL